VLFFVPLIEALLYIFPSPFQTVPQLFVTPSQIALLIQKVTELVTIPPNPAPVSTPTCPAGLFTDSCCLQEASGAANAEQEVVEETTGVAAAPEGVTAVKIGKKQGFLSRFSRKKKGESDLDNSATNSPTIKAGGGQAEDSETPINPTGTAFLP
jgi:hypothetical protein